MGSPSVARGSRSRGAVAAFTWNQWQPSPGIGGSFAVESVAALPWNQWQLCRGISGNVRVESVAGLPWNQWQVCHEKSHRVVHSRFQRMRGSFPLDSPLLHDM